MCCQARNQWPKVIHRKWSHQSRLVEFGTLLIFKVIGQRWRSQGQIFRRGDTPRFALPLFCLINASKSKLYAGLHKVNHLFTLCLFKLVRLFCKLAIPIYMCVFVILPSKKKKYFMFGWTWEIEHKIYCLLNVRVITKLPNSEQSYKGKVKTHNYINRQNQSTTGKLWKP